MFGSLGGQRLGMPIDEFFAMANGQPADTDGSYQARIVAIEQVGDAATAVLEEGYWGKVSFTDFFSLVRVDGDSKTVSKTFAHTGGEPPTSSDAPFPFLVSRRSHRPEQTLPRYTVRRRPRTTARCREHPSRCERRDR
jgi:putative lumazine-binding protein